MATQAKVRALATNEQAGNFGATHIVTFGPGTDNLLSETTANTSMVFNLFLAQPGDEMVWSALVADPAFSDASDAAFNSTAFSFGDAGSATRFYNAVQLNVNGTEVLYSYNNTAYGPYTAETQVTATVASMAAKSLSNIDLGRCVLFICLLRLPTLVKAVTG